ncbi:AI-2E family transporter [Frankia sp. B2]|uniref:AI-2E family transporter n=1 Tax=Frankia sp. B2 TaxID=2541730 RepID=UPI00106B426F|nr:AI-2E family transporter [Frankia sp. B2]TFE34401.1 AI-2E family transporter [Frankia sp. B2]
MRRVAGLGRVPGRPHRARRASAVPAGGGSSTAPMPEAAASEPPGGPRAAGGGESPARRADYHIPVALRVSAGWSWRLIVTGAAIYILLMVVGRVRIVVIPLIAGLLIAALIHPLAHRLQRLGMNRLGAAFTALFVFFAVFVGAGVAVGFNAANEIPTVSDQVSEGVEQIRGYLRNGPLHLSQSQIDNLVDDIRKSLANNRGRLVSGVISGASVAAEVLTGLLVTLFSTFFFLYDGDRIWNWIVTRFPDGAEERVRGAGREAWNTLTGYIRGTVFVAAVDAIGITIGLVGVGVPLVAPLALLTFFGGFVPIVGATVAGAAAVLVTLVSNGVPDALIILGVVLAVQQVEGHLLQPLVMRRAVRLHPLAIVIALSAGGVLAGIPGAIAAVPFAAMVNRVAGYLAVSGK